MKVVITNNWTGLGDLLSQSTLPELYTKLYGFDVYMSESQVFRNENNRKLIMMDPYIKGYADEKTNLVMEQTFNSPFPYDLDNTNYVARIEYMIFGKVFNNYPKIYYHPKFLPEWKDVTFIDLNSINYNSEYKDKKNNFQDYIKEHYENYQFAPEDFQSLDILDYIDIIFSCKRFVCTFSGNSEVASAINKQNVDCLVPQDLLNVRVYNCSMVHMYDNINYIGI